MRMCENSVNLTLSSVGVLGHRHRLLQQQGPASSSATARGAGRCMNLMNLGMCLAPSAYMVCAQS